jgi:beta-xylosidase
MASRTLKWEGEIVEAPWVRQLGKYFYVFYSGATFCNERYSVGVARSTSALGPFAKRSEPILVSNSNSTSNNRQWVGPGHNAVVSTGGHDYLVYHAWNGPQKCGANTGNRELMLDRIAWHGGWPSVNDGTPSTGEVPVPQVP